MTFFYFILFLCLLILSLFNKFDLIGLQFDQKNVILQKKKKFENQIKKNI